MVSAPEPIECDLRHKPKDGGEIEKPRTGNDPGLIFAATGSILLLQVHLQMQDILQVVQTHLMARHILVEQEQQTQTQMLLRFCLKKSQDSHLEQAV